MNLLKPYERKIMINLFNKIGVNVGEDFTNDDVTTNYYKLYKFIIDGNNYATTTKRDFLIVLSHNFPSNDEIFKKLQEEAKILNKAYISLEQLQALDEHEQKNYIKYDELLNKMNYLNIEYNYDKTDKNIKILLLLGLYVLHPPLRNDYCNMKIIKNINQDDKINNFLLIAGPRYYIIINRDKVYRFLGSIIIEITNLDLKNILDVYFSKFAQSNRYLFESKGGAYTKRQINYILNCMFKNQNKVLTIYNLRSAYITNFYKNHLDLKSRVELARNMRHSKDTAELKYYKNL